MVFGRRDSLFNQFLRWICNDLGKAANLISGGSQAGFARFLQSERDDPRISDQKGPRPQKIRRMPVIRRCFSIFKFFPFAGMISLRREHVPSRFFASVHNKVGRVEGQLVGTMKLTSRRAYSCIFAPLEILSAVFLSV